MGVSQETRKMPEYEEVPIEDFNPENCKTLKAFQVQYVLLESKVSELQKQLSEIKADEAKTA